MVHLTIPYIVEPRPRKCVVPRGNFIWDWDVVFIVDTVNTRASSHDGIDDFEFSIGRQL
jgi:hypothetical protein